MTKFYFAGRNPIGRKLYIDDQKLRAQSIEIVGVARDARDHDLRGEVPRRFYMPLSQATHEVLAVNLELRTASAPGPLADSVRGTVRQFDANILVDSVRTLDDLVDDSVSEEIATAKLSSLFAGLALLLACIGLYGLLSYAVAGRTREIGLRMALGANRGNLLWLVMREALVMVAVGVAVGLPAAVACSRALRSMLFEVSAADPLSLAGSVLLLGAVALAAAYLPARRATRIDPMVALRYE